MIALLVRLRNEISLKNQIYFAKTGKIHRLSLVLLEKAEFREQK